MRLFMTAIALAFSFHAFAHEGHDHNAPAAVQAPKGGVIKGMEKTYVEVVSKGKDLKIYVYDKELKPQDPTAYQMTAVAEIPRAKKTEAVILKAQGNVLEASYDAKGSHRYTLILSVKDPTEEHADKLKFTIEPRK